MKKFLGIMATILFVNAAFADSIWVLNPLDVNAFFTMYDASGNVQRRERMRSGHYVPITKIPYGPFCVDAGTRKYTEALTYTDISAYVEGPGGIHEACYVSPEVKRNMASWNFYNHSVVIERCTNPISCGEKRYKLVTAGESQYRATFRDYPGKRAVKECEKPPVVEEKKEETPSKETEMLNEITELKKQLQQLNTQVKTIQSRPVTINNYYFLQSAFNKLDKKMLTLLGLPVAADGTEKAGLITRVKQKLSLAWANFRNKMKCLGSSSCSLEERHAAASAFMKVFAPAMVVITIVSAVLLKKSGAIEGFDPVGTISHYVRSIMPRKQSIMEPTDIFESDEDLEAYYKEQQRLKKVREVQKKTPHRWTPPEWVQGIPRWIKTGKGKWVDETGKF